jgi:hypothetical protein
MPKPSILEQLDFFRDNLIHYYQVFETPNGQVIAVRETSITSIVSIVFLEPTDASWEWIDADSDVLKYLVDKVNEYLSTSPIERKIVTYYKDSTNIGDKLQGLELKQFVIGFDSEVNIKSGNFDVIFNAIRTSIFEILDTKEPTQQVQNKVLAVDFFMKNLLEVIGLEEDLGDVENQIWLVRSNTSPNIYPWERKDFFVVGDDIYFQLKDDKEYYYNGTITNIYETGSVSIQINYRSKGNNVVGDSNYRLENLFKFSIEITEYFDLKKLFNNNKQDNLAITQPGGFKLFIENTKKEIEQLIFLRSLQSPLDFEENIKLNQLLASKQEQLDKEIFGQNEIFMSQDNIFDDLFEQSFTPIQNSYNNIFAKDENGSDFFTPSGERSSLNDAENSLIRSSLFLEWFGDWQLAYQYKEAGIKDFACSKVLSPKFEPQVVWHGTGDEFSYFRFDNFPAAYFAVNKSYSQWFADLHAREGEGYTIPFFLSVNNPLDLTLFETRKIDPKTFFDYIFLQTGLTKDELDINPIFADSNLGTLETWMYLRNNPKMLKKLADSKLFDGIHFYETNPSIDESEPFYKTEAWIIFSPHQAKLADPSRGLLLFSSLKSFLLEKGGKI